jgi:hypothetical protein
MKPEIIEQMVEADLLRQRPLDKEKIKSMIESSQTNAKVIKMLPVTEETATVVFREIYESVRQLGDAQWLLLGYEPRNHEVSMDILQEMDIKEKLLLNQLPRFKKIRNDANYRGFKVTLSQAQQIIEFWNKCSNEIVKITIAKLK